MCTVYEPAVRLAKRAQSALPEAREKAPTWAATAAISAGFEFVPQPVFEATRVPAESYTLSVGWARTPVTPYWVRAGPSARMRRLSVPEPEMYRPGIRMLAPVPTTARVEMLVSRTAEPTTTALLTTVATEFEMATE